MQKQVKNLALIELLMSFRMNSKDEGLTVGELTIAIAVLIIGFLVWSGIAKRQSSQSNFYPQINSDVINSTGFFRKS